MRRWICLLLIGMLLPFSALGGEDEPSIRVREETVHPWEPTLIQFNLPQEDSVDVLLLNETGEESFVIAREVLGRAGQNTLYWNGTYNHEAAPEGKWRLYLQTNTTSAETEITIGAPVVTTTPAPAEDEDAEQEPPEETANPDEVIGEEPYGFTPEQLAEGAAEETENQPVAVVPPAKEEGSPSIRFTPSTTSPYEGQDTSLNYWTLPMDIRDEESIWQALMAPITVMENGKGEKAQIILRAEPSADSAGVGTITCATQGVHVLERGEEWSLIECYSSSFHDSPILNWNALAQGYVPTRYLKEEIPNQELGMVIDKLTQRLYIFKEGHLFTTLMVSTGLANVRQPYNETRSGEFLLTSKVGTFRSDNLLCGLAIRFNKGDLLHEVPYIQGEDGSKNYKSTEAKLGSKASHGCIRVQRKKSPEGVNMAWIWAALKKNSKTRLMIWEDWQGRQIEIPSEDTLLYYNPNKGQYYHAKDHCESTRAGITLKAFTYGELDEKKYAKLKPCEYCAPTPRKAKLEEVNAIYAFGGDHDPVLTEARQNCPRPLK